MNRIRFLVCSPVSTLIKMTARSIWRLAIGVIVVLLSVVVFLFEKWLFTQDFKTRGKLMRVQIVLIIQMGLGAISFFVWKNITNVFGNERKSGEVTKESYRHSPRVWKFVIIIYLLLAHSSYLCNVFLVRTDPHIFAMVSYFTLGLHIQIATGIVVIKVFNFLFKLLTRHSFQEKTMIFLVLFYAISVCIYGFYNAQRPPTIKRVTIPVKDLPANLDGVTITHIPDIHIGPTNGRAKLRHLVDMVNSINSDMIVIVGDLLDGQVEDLREALAPVKNFKSKFGIYYVTGNHEYYTMAVDEWFLYLRSLRVHILHNSHVKIPPTAPAADQICLTGTDDIEASRIGYDNHGFDLDKAVAGCSPDQPVVLLAHQPKAAKLAFQSKHRIDLVLSGHTHGGQMFPLVIGAYLVNPYYLGLYRHGESSHIYVSEGTFYWGIPLRIMTSKELAVIKLTKM